MIPLVNNANVDLSDLINYPFGRIKDNTGTGNGTAVNRNVYGDLHVNIAKMMALYGILPNVQPDNETNGYQIIEALIALSSKNTIVSDISTTGGITPILVASMKIGFLKLDEVMYCRSSCNFSTEASIKGTNTATTYALTVVDSFNIGDYLYLIKTSTGVEVRRIVDESNLDAVVGTYNYLKAATYSQEIAGTSNAVATNPLSNVLAFVERVNGATSAMSLATTLRNGLYPKEHFAIVAGLAVSKLRNVGSVSGIDVDSGTIGTSYPCLGDIVSCSLQAKSGKASNLRITVANTMTDLNYYVRPFVQSLSANIFSDNAIGTPVFKPISATVFDLNIQEFDTQTQNLKIYLEVVKI